MKYTPPAKGAYESKFTAKFVYDIVDRLFTKHDIKGDETRIRDHTSNLDNLWRDPRVYPKLDELVRTYLLGGLEEALPGFESVFRKEGPLLDNMQAYKDELIRYHGTKEKAKEAVKQPYGEIRKRYDRLAAQSEIIRQVLSRTKRELIAMNAANSIGHLAQFYYGESILFQATL